MTSYEKLGSFADLPIFGVTKLEEHDGRITKVPYSAIYGGRASVTNKSAWTYLYDAENFLRMHKDEYLCLAMVISKENNIVFIDIDHCVDDDGFLDERGIDIVTAFKDQYRELSQSGSGVHILCKGEIPKSFKNSKNGVEMYDDKRFVALTLRTPDHHMEISKCQDAINYVYERYKTPRKVENIHHCPVAPILKDDRRIIDYAIRRDKKFPILFSGDWRTLYSSQSEADLALCLILAFWTDCDPERIDRIFRSSNLYRAKWDRDDYRSNTITSACGRCEETLSEYMKRKDGERSGEYERYFIEHWH